MFEVLLQKHKDGIEYPFVEEELPLYEQKFGGDTISMSAPEEADFLMTCNEFEINPGMDVFLENCYKRNIPMYVLSNSGFRAEALKEVLERFGIGKYFKAVYSSADFGRIKPCREFFELAIDRALVDNPDEKRDNIVYIGDLYETDVIGALNAGIKVAWLNKKDAKEDEIATYIVTSAERLSGLFFEV